MNVSAPIVSREPANLATLPTELIYAICVQALAAAKPLPPTEPRYVWRQGKSAEIAIACRYREWTLSLRLICRTMNVVLEPLVLTRLTLNREDILSGASGMHEMLETIASGSVSPIAKYTKSLFIGSLRDMTSVADTDDSDMEEFGGPIHPSDDETYGDDENEEVGDEDEDEDEGTPSSDGSWHGMGPQIHVAFSDVADVEDVAAEDDPDNFPDDDAETILQLASLIRDALIKFTALKSFKWNIRAASYKTHVFAAVTEALSTLPSLSDVAFSIHPERFDFPALPTFSNTKSLSLCIYGLGNYRRGLTLPKLISTMAKTLPAFPAVEDLQVHHYDSKSFEGTDPTIKNVLSYCSPERAPPLKSLDLLNVPFVVDDTTIPFLRRLETLSISFMAELDEATASTGALPPDRNGSTSLRSLTIYGYFANSAFSIIPLSGLRHLSLLEMISDRDDDGPPFTRETFDTILPGHTETLESLAVLPGLENPQSWTYDDSMMALIARCRKLQHLAVMITVGTDSAADASIVKKVVVSVTRLDKPLRTLAIDVYDPEHSTNRATYREPRPAVLEGVIKQLESIVIPDSESTDANPHQYPAFIRIHNLVASYRLGRSGAGDVRYIQMNRDEVENLVSTLPGGEDARLW